VMLGLDFHVLKQTKIYQEDLKYPDEVS
jgi:hypothetical protein